MHFQAQPTNASSCHENFTNYGHNTNSITPRSKIIWMDRTMKIRSAITSCFVLAGSLTFAVAANGQDSIGNTREASPVRLSASKNQAQPYHGATHSRRRWTVRYALPAQQNDSMSCLQRSNKAEETASSDGANRLQSGGAEPVVLAGVGSNLGDAQVVRHGNMPSYCGGETIIYETVATPAPAPHHTLQELQAKYTMTY